MNSWTFVFIIMGMATAIPCVALLGYIHREKIRKASILAFKRHLLLRVVVHYPGCRMKEYWRIIPHDGRVKVMGMTYQCDDTAIVRQSSDIFVQDGGTLVLEKKRYSVVLKKALNALKCPEIHYYHGIPAPIDFNAKREAPSVNMHTFNAFANSTVVTQLLTIRGQKAMLSIMMIILVVIGGIVAYQMLFGK